MEEKRYKESQKDTGNYEGKKEMKLRAEVIYRGNPAWIVGIRHPKSNESGIFYDLAREENTPHPKYKDIHESHVTFVGGTTTMYAGNGWCGVAHHPEPKIEIVKG